jgi:hypothetical protein
MSRPRLPVRARATFTDGRIGRRHDAQPLDLTTTDPGSWAEQIDRYVRRYLGSRDVDVEITARRDGTDLRADVYVGGLRRVATATIERMDTP